MANTVYISTNDTAKLIRKALKDAFPNVKFSVRGKKYSGGSSIDVSWTDGPLASQIDSIVKKFEGASFDGMIDLKSYVEREFNGKKVHFGADYVFTRHEISQNRVDALTAIIEKLDKDLWLTVAVRMNHPSPCAAVEYAHNAREFAYSLLRACPGA